MGIEYERGEDGKVWAVVPDRMEVTRGYEVAAWFDKLTLEGGRYEVQPVTIGYEPTDEAHAYYGMVRIPAVCTYQHTPSLWGGVPFGNGGSGPRDEVTEHRVSPYWYEIRNAIGK
jgi:hypothetical protein